MVLGGGIAAIPGLLLDSAKAAAEDAASVAKLQKAVENSGASWAKYEKSLTDVVDAGVKLGFADSQQRDALSLLTAQTGSAEEAQKRLKLAMDFSRGANIDLGAAAKLLGKVTDENVNVLGRYGISVAKGADATELFGKIQAKFGGQSEAFAKSTAGQMAAFKLSIGELQESFGALLLPALGKVAELANTRLVPALNKVVGLVGDIVKEGGDLGAFADSWKELTGIDLSGLVTTTRSIRESIAGIVAKGGELVAFFKNAEGAGLTLHNTLESALGQETSNVIIGALEGMRTKIGDVTGTIRDLVSTGDLGLLADNMKEAFGIDITPLIAGFETVKGKVLEVTGAISAKISELATSKNLGEFALKLKESFGIDIAPIIANFEEIKGIVEKAIGEIPGIVQAGLAEVKAFWDAHGTEIKAVVEGFLEQIRTLHELKMRLIKSVIVEGLAGISQGWGEHGDTIQTSASKIWEGIQTAIGAVLGELVPFIREQLGEIITWTDENWPLIEQTIRTVMAAIVAVVDVLLKEVIAWWDVHGETILAIVKVLWETIKFIISSALLLILGIIRATMQVINGDWAGAWETVQAVFRRIFEKLPVDLQIFFDAFVRIWQAEIKKITDIIDGFVKAIQFVKDRIWELKQAIESIPKMISLPPVPKLPGFQVGGSFTVGGHGGPDSQLVAFRATPGERVTVSNSYNLTINSQARHEQVAGDFAMMRSLAGA